MAQLIGLARIGKDAEIRTVGGEPVANLSLCFTRYDPKQKDDPKTRGRVAQWVDGSLWGRRAEALAQYLTKGAQVVVTIDDPHIQEYATRDGGTGHKLTGRVSSIELAGGKGDGQQSAPAPAPRPAPAPPPRTASPATDMGDDIPF